MRLANCAGFVLALLLSAACSSGPLVTPEPASLTLAGSTSMGPVLSDLAAAFQEQNPNVVVTVLGGGTAAGLEDLRAGRADIGTLSWAEGGSEAHEGLQLTPLARDLIAVIVHPSNPISNLTSLQLRALYRGETLDWTVLGGLAGPPEIISREDGSGTRYAFESMAMSGDRVTLSARVMPTSGTVLDRIAEEPLAVGYVTLSALDNRVRAVSLEGVAPSAETGRSGAYSLMRVLYLATRDRPSAESAAFIAFATSRQAQPIIARRHLPVR